MKIVYAPRELDIVIRKLRSQHPIFLWCSARWFVSELRWLISLLIRLSKGGLLSIYVILFPFFIILIIFVFIYSICPLSYLLARCCVFFAPEPLKSRVHSRRSLLFE